MEYPDPLYITCVSLDEFIIGMLSLGKPLETSIVGVFDDSTRGSRRDMDLPLHRDGEYSEELAKAQGGDYVEFPGIDVVGLYCIRQGETPCYTLLDDGINGFDLDLKTGEGLVFDNRRLLHGRRGLVGNRLLMRMWIERK